MQVHQALLAVLGSCGLPAAPGYFCATGFCAGDGLPRPAAPACGPATELRLGGGTAAERVQAGRQYCEAHAGCTGFAIDPAFPITLAFNASNVMEAAQPNAEWTLFWRGPPQPLPPAPPAPAPAPHWKPLLPRGPCATDSDCSLNGVCDVGRCRCYPSSWWAAR